MQMLAKMMLSNKNPFSFDLDPIQPIKSALKFKKLRVFKISIGIAYIEFLVINTVVFKYIYLTPFT